MVGRYFTCCAGKCLEFREGGQLRHALVVCDTALYRMIPKSNNPIRQEKEGPCHEGGPRPGPTSSATLEARVGESSQIILGCICACLLIDSI